MQSSATPSAGDSDCGGRCAAHPEAMEIPENLTDYPLLPFLNPPRWEPGGEAVVCSRPLADHAESPVVALGYQTPEGVVFHPKPEDYSGLIAQSLGALHGREGVPGWSQVPLPGGGEVFAREGDWLTASDILDPHFLDGAAAMAGGAAVALAVPTRETMFLSASAGAILPLAIRRFLEAPQRGEFALVPHLFIYAGGELRLAGEVSSEMLAKSSASGQSAPEAPGESGCPRPGSTAPDPGEIPEPIFALADDGSGQIAVFPVAGLGAEDVFRLIPRALNAYLGALLAREAFSGRVVFVADGIAPGERGVIVDLAANISSEFANRGFGSLTGSPLQVECRFS